MKLEICLKSRRIAVPVVITPRIIKDGFKPAYHPPNPQSFSILSCCRGVVCNTQNKVGPISLVLFDVRIGLHVHIIPLFCKWES
jgi:hypothetical protein